MSSFIYREHFGKPINRLWLYEPKKKIKRDTKEKIKTKIQTSNYKLPDGIMLKETAGGTSAKIPVLIVETRRVDIDPLIARTPIRVDETSARHSPQPCIPIFI